MLNIILAGAVAASAAGLDIEMQRAWRQNGIANVTFKLTNNTSTSYKRVHVECVLLDKTGKAHDIAPAIVSNVAAGGTAYGKASVVSDMRGGDIDCRVTLTMP